MSMCGREHYAVCHGNCVLDRKPCRLEGSCPIEIDNSPLLHDRNSSQRFIFTPLLTHSLEHLE